MSSLPRIAVVCEFPTLNGGERSMLAAVERLGTRFEVVFLAPAEGPLAAALAEQGLPHIPFEVRDREGGRQPREELLQRLHDLVANVRPDLLHANSLSMGRLTGSLANRLAIPCVAHLRDIIRLSRGAIDDLNQNTRLLAVSEATRAHHVAQGLDAPRVDVLYNGVDCDQFQPRPATGFLHRELGLPPNAFLVATIGQIGLRKGQDLFAEAAAQVAPCLENAHFLLIGERNSSKAESVEFEQSVVARFHAAGLGSRLHRLGRRDDVDRLLNELGLLVHAAHQEPLGRVLLEAAASGVPIVATRVGGTPEILEDGVSARLVPPGDAGALARGMEELASDAPLRQRLGTAARVVAVSRFSIEERAEDLARVWGRVLSSWSP